MQSRRITRDTMVAAVITLLLLCPVLADDWPTWRYDTGRTACSPADLPDPLHLQWGRELPPPMTAWPYEPRMQFDPCYEPVAVGKVLFVGSPNDGSVTAYDTETGDQKWRFYTNGPVRFAPAAWQGKLYVASDDGRIYCLDAETGRPRWIFRAAPEDRPDLHHLGNNRLVSFWPVRGGPVIVDGVLYAGSGIWPTMGTFVYALDPETGKALWCNNRLSHIANTRIDHNRVADSALAPQGYLACEGGKLLVPNGRSMPVGLDPKTGALLYYVQGYRNGACQVTARGRYVFVGRQAVLDINTGREMGERWHEGNPETPAEFSPRHDLFETPFVPYKFVPACDAWSALSPGIAYGSHQGTFYAYDLEHAAKTTYKKKAGDQVIEPGKWEAPLVWKLATPPLGGTAEKPVPAKAPGPESSAIIRAGRRLYGHAGNTLMAVNLPAEGKDPAVAWEEKLPGTPATLLAADDKLFVVTDEGHLLCFGAKEGEPVTHARPNAPLLNPGDEASRRVAEILKIASDAEGYAIVLGIKDGRIVEELLRQSKLKVLAVDGDAKAVDALRDRLVAADLYGRRTEAFSGDPVTFALPPYIASLVVSENLTGPEIADRMAAKDLLRVLHPYGGTACLNVPDTKWNDLRAWLSSTDVENAELARADGLAVIRRIGPLPESAHWTHECADAARTYFSKDRRVKPPLGVLWYGDGPDHGFKKHKDYHVGVKPQVVNGRLFAFDEKRKVLQAYDVYTGRVLWKNDAAEFTRFASMPDGIYVAGGNACVVYDPGTGAELKRFTYRAEKEDDRPLFVADMRVGEDVIVVAAAFEKVRKIPEGLYDSAVLVGLDRKTGKQLWALRAKDRFNHHALALGGGIVFCTDSLSNKGAGDLVRRGEAPETLDSTVRALDARTGEVKWQRTFTYPFASYGDAFWSVQSLDDALFYSEPCDVLIVFREKRFHAVNGRTGEPLWERQGGGQPIMVKGELYYEQGGAAFDVRTGKPLPSKASVRGGNGCNHAVANEYFIFRRTFTAAYFNIQTGEACYLRNARSGCTNSLIPADGVVSGPCFSVGCVCNHPVETSFCLMHMPEVEGWDKVEPTREPLPLGERDPAKWRAAREAAPRRRTVE